MTGYLIAAINEKREMLISCCGMKSRNNNKIECLKELSRCNKAIRYLYTRLERK